MFSSSNPFPQSYYFPSSSSSTSPSSSSAPHHHHHHHHFPLSLPPIADDILFHHHQNNTTTTHDPLSSPYLLNISPLTHESMVNLGGPNSAGTMSKQVVGSFYDDHHYPSGGGGSFVPKFLSSKKPPVKKDRHSKIYTAQGLRDRRVRLSIEIAREFFDLQDMLGFDKASKTLEWLLTKSKRAIKDLSRNKLVTAEDDDKYGNLEDDDDDGDGDETGIVLVAKSKKKTVDEADSLMMHPNQSDAVFPKTAKECRAKARERARERTRDKMCTMNIQDPAPAAQTPNNDVVSAQDHHSSLFLKTKMKHHNNNMFCPNLPPQNWDINMNLSTELQIYGKTMGGQ